MSEYVPTTEQVRIAYSIIDGDASTSIIEQRRLAFDRWLRQVKAEAWDEGVRHGEACDGGMTCPGDSANPYRIESQETP